MQVQLLGMEDINFSNDKGEVIKGSNIYVSFKDERVNGLKTSKFFIKDNIQFPECKLQDTINLSFNMKGKVEFIFKQ